MSMRLPIEPITQPMRRKRKREKRKKREQSKRDVVGTRDKCHGGGGLLGVRLVARPDQRSIDTDEGRDNKEGREVRLMPAERNKREKK